MTGPSGEDLQRLDGNAAAGVLQTIFAVEMTTASCKCPVCRSVSQLGALHMYGGEVGCVLRCPACEEMMVCITSLPAGHYMEFHGIFHVRS